MYQLECNSLSRSVLCRSATKSLFREIKEADVQVCSKYPTCLQTRAEDQWAGQQAESSIRNETIKQVVKYT